MRPLAALALTALPIAVLGCRPERADDRAAPPPSASALTSARARSADPGAPSAVPAATGAGEAGVTPVGYGDPMTSHAESREDLLALFSVGKGSPRDPPPKDAAAFLEKTFGVGSPARLNQGNKAIAQHLVSRAKCLEGLRDVVLQTEEQRASCGGAENMVPLRGSGKSGAGHTCIDVFEFPNKACELPVVWAAPVQAAAICALQGKRLCAQEEWVLACRGDPGGGAPSTYAYGEALDLAICNTSKPHRVVDGVVCDPDSAASAWKTCASDTEPAGSFPRCRSRYGVFDQHGNVAEIMTRLDADGQVYSQLKGSAFFYTEVAREPGGKVPEGRETYADHCAHDPRWHVEAIREAWHVNYHLGFRCCKTVR